MSESSAGHQRMVSMRWKMLAAFAGAFTIVFLFIAIWVFQYVTQNTTNRLTTQLRASTIGGATTIDAKIFKELITDVQAVPDPKNPTGLGYPNDALYKNVAYDLYRINQIVSEANPYSYFKDPKDGKLYFAASAGYFATPQFGVPFKVPVDAIVPPESYALMDAGLERTTDQSPYTDQYGSWISTYTPIVAEDGTRVGAIGVDYPLTYVAEVQRQVQSQLYPVLAISYAVLLVLVLLISTSIARPLRRLRDAAQRVADGEYDLDVTTIVKSKFPDEMGQLAQAFAVMAAKVGARERSLTQEVQRLKVEIDESRRAAAVKEITESDFFSDLTTKAADMRRRIREQPGEA